MIRSSFIRIKRKMTRRNAWRKHRKELVNNKNWDTENIIEYNTFLKNNANIEYHVSYGDVLCSDKKHKWVGIQEMDSVILAIPNDEDRLLDISRCEFIETETNCKLFKWTGGCSFGGAIYAFPRSENCLLKYTPSSQEYNLVSIGTNYSHEHHYGGVCTSDGMIYLPPRNTDYILKFDINSGMVKKIHLCSKWLHGSFRYCGSVRHPNGYIYFLPERNDKVLKLDPKTDSFNFIGDIVSPMTFDAKTGPNGNIYGFSAYEKGILQIDVWKNNVSIIHQDIYFGAYGTKMGLDGWMYSVPGDGTKIWRFNPEKDICEEFYDIKDTAKAKYAGGATLSNGTIVFCPATAKKVISLIPSERVIIPHQIQDLYYSDCY